MEKYNIDEQLHRKFSERTIAPSPNAWERIAYNRKQQQKRKRKLLLYKIAAVIVISLGLFGLFINNNSVITPQESKVVQETKSTVPVIEQQPQVITATVHKQAVVALPPAQQAPVAHKNNKPVLVDSITKQHMGIALQQLELQKANEVAYSINQLALQKRQVTEDDVEALLLNAQKEIAMEGLKNKSLPASDTALLKEAETQVENSFREKTLGIFKHKFRTIKIALSDK